MATWERWRGLIADLEERGLTFRDVGERFLGILHSIDELRRQGDIPEGVYRQKGNVWRDMIITLIETRCNVKAKEREIRGWTDVHRVDFAYVAEVEEARMPIFAGEAKMLGSPEHVVRDTGELKPERPISIDLDKRIKEMKYTSVDLKLRFGALPIENWSDWIGRTPPKFFPFLACRVGKRNRIDHLTDKFQGLSQYVDGIGIFLYEERNGKYHSVEDEQLEPFLIDKTIGLIEASIHHNDQTSP